MQLTKLIEVEEITSTNDYLKENYRTLPSYTIIKADHQTSGRGQFDRKWHSNPKENLMFSLLIKDELKDHLENIRNWIIKSLLKVLKAYQIPATFKTPNDIYVKDHKICGILIETKIKGDLCEYIVIGIGLNINQTIFKNLQATSFKKELGESTNIKTVFKKIIESMAEHYDH